jgi:hypothetical protein
LFAAPQEVNKPGSSKDSAAKAYGVQSTGEIATPVRSFASRRAPGVKGLHEMETPHLQLLLALAEFLGIQMQKFLVLDSLSHRTE